MYVAEEKWDKERRYRTPQDAVEDKAYICPVCHTEVFLTENSEQIKIFKHTRDVYCTQRLLESPDVVRDESERHLWMKATALNTLLDNNHNHSDVYAVEYRLGDRRPDAYIELFIRGAFYKVAVECIYKSFCNNDPWQLKQKTKDYTEMGIHTLWLVDIPEYIIKKGTEDPNSLLLVPEIYPTLSSYYYGKIYGFYDDTLYALHFYKDDDCVDEYGRETKFRKLEMLPLTNKDLLTIKPPKKGDKSGVSVVTFGDYTDWMKHETDGITRLPYDI